MDERDDPEGEPMTRDAFQALVVRARGGDAAAMARVATWLDANPDACRGGGDLAAAAERIWIRRASGGDPVVGEACTRFAAELAARLAGADPDPIVELLARRAAIGWVQVHALDCLAADAPDAAPPRGRLVSECQDRAQRRYVSALAELAPVRKLIGQDTSRRRHPAGRSSGATRRCGRAGDAAR